MTSRIRIALAAAAVAASTPVLAADLAESAMAGDPNWPQWMDTVSPSVSITERPREPLQSKPTARPLESKEVISCSCPPAPSAGSGSLGKDQSPPNRSAAAPRPR
jgi:hypothetical protein